MTKDKRKQYADQYIDRIQRRNSLAVVIATITWMLCVICLVAGFYLNNFPTFLAAFPCMGIAWLVGLTIKR